jgi:hypothetical protein
VGPVIQYAQRDSEARHQRWDRIERADLFAQYGDLQAQGLSQRQAAKVLDGLCRKVAFWRQNSKMGSRKINDLGASTFLFSVFCDRARSGHWGTPEAQGDELESHR